MSRSAMRRFLPMALLAGWSVAAAADAPADRAAVLDVITRFFEAMTARDVAAMASMMSEDGIIYGYREGDDGLQVIRRPHAAYLESLAGGQGRIVERFWDPQVMVHDRLATAWTPYDFHVDGEFSHCGVNNFSLLKTDAGWIITGVVFSIEADCGPSPLGPFPREARE